MASPQRLVLFADDDPLLHRVLGFKLQQQQWEMISAYDGEQALRLAREKRPALIILDGMMPVMDGFAMPMWWAPWTRGRTTT